MTRVRLANWRNFQKAEVELANRAFLVGPNAAGKSNFLYLFRFLRTLVVDGGGFQRAVSELGGISAIRSLGAKRNSDIEIAVDLGTSEQPKLWEYELRFNQTNQPEPRLLLERIARLGRELRRRPDTQDSEDPVRLRQTLLEQVHVNKEFRSLASFLGTIRYLHIVPQLLREPDRSVGRTNDPFGGDFLERILRIHNKTREGRLNRIRKALRVAVPLLEKLELRRDATGTAHLYGKFRNWRAHGAWQTEHQLSDGTLRLFGLLWSLLEEGGPLLIEEPELSLHPAVVERLPAMFARVQLQSGRQVLVSTHSPDFLSDEGIGLDEVLLLEPGADGTTVRPATAIQEIGRLLGAGFSLQEALLPRTRPTGTEQLSLFSS